MKSAHVTLHHKMVKDNRSWFYNRPGVASGTNIQNSQLASGHQMLSLQSMDFYDPVSVISTAAVFLAICWGLWDNDKGFRNFG